MNRAERRARGMKPIPKKMPTLQITQEQLDEHMPDASDGDVVMITRYGTERAYRIEVVAATAKPH